ncbi:hypothetical protein JCGZ_03963 [Jatropha curcas]|uniref:Aminotransferase-like plant mobile domain-containing protein n=1 Tax=Jatropha curcas TaxID=180498 RepID=A0A067KZI7_JATCU|nr:hypothetical protein JCGZ_03963 [Jatropha curcas]
MKGMITGCDPACAISNRHADITVPDPIYDVGGTTGLDAVRDNTCVASGGLSDAGPHHSVSDYDSVGHKSDGDADLDMDVGSIDGLRASVSQLPEVPSSAYTSEMNTLGAIPDITIFEGERVPVSRNPLTPGTRPLQLLPLPGTEFPVDLAKARAGGSSTNTSAFWDLLDPPMHAQVIAAGFGYYAAGLRRTQPRFPPAMRYVLMERWNDYTHTFIFGFGEITLTPADYTAITGLRFDGSVAPLDARY